MQCFLLRNYNIFVEISYIKFLHVLRKFKSGLEIEVHVRPILGEKTRGRKSLSTLP
jgi:hypothetical protein